MWMLRFFRGRSKAPSTVSGWHVFVEPPDPRMGLALGGAEVFEAPSAMTSMVAATSVNRDWCSAPGCGKPREDPIHWPTEDVRG